MSEKTRGDYVQLRYNEHARNNLTKNVEGKHMNTQQQHIKKEDNLYKDITQSVLSDFMLNFSVAPKEEIAVTPKNEEKKQQKNHQETSSITTKKIKKTQKPTLPPENFSVIQERLDRLEKRIHALDETKSEYMEERVALEEKKFFLKNDLSPEMLGKKGSTEKEKQLKEVEDLLSKKTFGYVAPVISPVKEKELRIKTAQEAAMLDNTPTPAPKENSQTNEEKSLSDRHLREALWTRESFIKHLQTMNKGKWYENPSQNRDMINEYVIKTAELLSDKNSSKINMDDMQTARLFLFKRAPEYILKHPAFSYVESFYNYQNDQGHSGNDLGVEKVEKAIQ